MASQQGKEIYVMRDNATQQYKIGQSVDPGRRTHQVRETHPQTQKVATFPASHGTKAESASHRAVEQNLGMKNTHGDWYKAPPGTKTKHVTSTVGSAVKSSNAGKGKRK